MNALHEPVKPNRTGLIAVYLIFAALLVRTIGQEENRPQIAWYLALELIYLTLFTLTLWRYKLPGGLMHLYLGTQCLLVLGLISLRPQFDFLITLFIILTYQVSLAFSGRRRWTWLVILVFLTAGSLIFYLGILRGLALSLTTIAGEFILSVYLIVNNELGIARAESQTMVEKLKVTNQQLKSYSEQVEELAAMQERNRLARELHDTVSQLIFSISLTARAAQILLEKDPQRVSGQILCLQGMTRDALRQLRSLITQLRSLQQP